MMDARPAAAKALLPLINLDMAPHPHRARHDVFF